MVCKVSRDISQCLGSSYVRAVAQGSILCTCLPPWPLLALLHLTESLPLLSSSLAARTLAASDGLWSERTDALQTRSHTLCERAKRGREKKKKKCWKKGFSLHPDRVHSDHLFFHLALKAVARLCHFSLFINARQLSGSAVRTVSQASVCESCCDREQSSVWCTDIYTYLRFTSACQRETRRQPG